MGNGISRLEVARRPGRCASDHTFKVCFLKIIAAGKNGICAEANQVGYFFALEMLRPEPSSGSQHSSARGRILI
jgi:hypothetical protein